LRSSPHELADPARVVRHIGIYGYRVGLVNLRPSLPTLEQVESLAIAPARRMKSRSPWAKLLRRYRGVDTPADPSARCWIPMTGADGVPPE
jgi:CMP-2-keto-3-deoxyoctulosonic acid synthetase